MSLFMKALCLKSRQKEKEPLQKRYAREYFYENENWHAHGWVVTANVEIAKQMKPQGELKTTLFVNGKGNH